MVHVERPQQSGTWICCVPCYWLRRSKAVHKALLTFAMLLVTSLLVTSPVLFLITTLPEGDQPRDCAPLDEPCIRERDGTEGVCESKPCQEASRRMLASMKTGVDPCNDFYQFACGNFHDREPYQPSSSFSMLQSQVDRQIEKMLANETGKMIGVFEKLGLFHESCLRFKDREVDFAPVYGLLEELGGYLPPQSLEPADITPLVLALLEVTGAPLFDLYLDVDLYNRSRISIFLDLPSKYQADTFFTEKQEDGPRWRDSFPKAEGKRKRSNPAESRAYTLIKNAREEQRSQRIQKIIQGLLPKDMETRQRNSEADQLLQFCLALSKIYPRHKDLYNWVDVDQRVYVPYNLTNLQESFGYIRWGTLLNGTLGTTTAEIYRRDSVRSGYPKEDRLVYVYVTAPRYFRSLGRLLNRFSKRVGCLTNTQGDYELKLWMLRYVQTSRRANEHSDWMSARDCRWDDSRVLEIFQIEYSDVSSSLNRVIHNGLLLLYAVDTLHDIVNVTASDNWNESCSKLTKDVFGEIVGALYVQQYRPDYLETLASRVSILFERVKETLAERMLVMSWLDDDTRAQALLKLNALRGKFKVWPGFHNESLLAREMAEVSIDPDDFFSNVIRRFRQTRNPNGQLLRRNMSDRWRNPYAVNAYYEASTNSIVIPLAMMTAWSWSWDGGPSYAVHATLGSVIAHEILHAFDLHHRRLPIDPDIVNDQWLWITPEAWSKLEAKIECVARLYAKRFWRKVKFFGNYVDVQFDWNVTRNENVADIGALQISHQTWQTLSNGKDRTLPGLEALRPSQLFFLSAAQTYCSNMTAEAYILSVELDYHTPYPERVNVVMMNSPAFAEAFRCPTGARMNPSNKCSTW